MNESTVVHRQDSDDGLLLVPIGLYCCLFASGFAALNFELVWTRLLLYAYGNTVPAMTTVVTAIMAGLALGSIAGGRLADRSPRPLRVYGFLEVGLAALCLATPTVLEWIRSVYLQQYPSFTDSGGAMVIFLRYGLTLGALLVPSFLMGATLPAAGLSLVRAGQVSGNAAAWAYGFNTLGAAIGTLAAGYFLLPSFGISRTNLIAAVVSGSAGIAALLLARRAGNRVPSPAAIPPPRQAPSRARREWVLLASLSVSGAVGMLLQVVWVRSLTLVVGSLTYSFTCILVTFLLGIAGGSILHAWLSNRGWGQVHQFAYLMAGVGVSAILLLPFFPSLPGLFLTLSHTLGVSPARMKLIQFLVVIPVIVFPTTLLGLIIPTWVGHLAREGQEFGSRFGVVYAWNTTGAVLGSVSAGFFLIPSLGAQRTLVLGAILVALTAAVLAVLFGQVRSRVVAGAALALSIGAAFFPPWDARLLNFGVFYYGTPGRDFGSILPMRFSEILYFREGIGSAVAVARFPNGSIALIINGKVDAGNHGDMDTQVKLAAIPMLLHPAPRRVAVIGLGSGVTSGTAALFPETESVETVEIEPAVAEAARFFERENRGILFNPVHRLVLGDARSHFLAPGPHYDVVISEPSNPWLAGEADLFTEEFFRAVRDRLAPGGIFCQWIHGYLISPEALRLVARTFESVFPGATLWSPGGLDFQFIGTKEGTAPIDPEAVRRRLDSHPRLKDVAAYFGDRPEEGFVEDLLLDPEELRRFSGEGPLQRDDFPILEFLAADSLHIPSADAHNTQQILTARDSESPGKRPGRFDAERRFRAGKYHLAKGRPLQADREFLQAYALGHKPVPRWEKSIRLRRPLARPGDPPLEFYPAVGGYRPDETDEPEAFAVWAGSMDYFLDISGVIGIGRNSGEQALRVAGHPVTTATAFFTPIPVPPSAEVRIDFEMFLPPIPIIAAGCAVMEFDAVLPGKGQLSGSEKSLHSLNSRVVIRIPGGREAGWRRHSFAIRTSPATRMVQFHFFRDGVGTNGDALFRRIDVRRILSVPVEGVEGQRGE
jgi:spermidine synthase